MAEVPTLRTPRTRLEPITPADEAVLHWLWTEPGVRRYLWDGEIIDRKTTRETVAKIGDCFAAHDTGLFLMHPHGDGVPFGFVGFLPEEESGELELIYGLKPRFWGQGLAVEGSVGALRDVFGRLGQDSVLARTDGPNEASVAVMKRLGMVFENERNVGAFGTTITYSLEADVFAARFPEGGSQGSAG